MTFALLLTAAALAVLLSLIAFVQLLYLESLRLRTRDLPSLEFFKETLEKALGMKTETGLLWNGCCLWRRCCGPWRWPYGRWYSRCRCSIR